MGSAAGTRRLTASGQSRHFGRRPTTSGPSPGNGHRQGRLICLKGVKLGSRDVSFDHLVGAGEQHRWHFEAERIRSLEIDTQLEFGRLVKRDISRIGTPNYLIDDVGEAAIDVR